MTSRRFSSVRRVGQGMAAVLFLGVLRGGTAHADGVSEMHVIGYYLMAVYIGGPCLAWLVALIALVRPPRAGAWVFGSLASVLAGVGVPSLAVGISPDDPPFKALLVGAAGLLILHQVKFFVFRKRPSS